MSPDPFVHLHVASGYSLQYGASHPHVLAERAAGQEMDTLALTDRNGTYGAVKFVKACLAVGIRPVLGVDLAYRSLLGAAPEHGRHHARGPAPRPVAPVRGGAFREPALPRVTLLATGRAGWAALCRLVSAAHLAGPRGTPVTTLELVAEHAGRAGDGADDGAGDGLLALLGPASDLGAAVAGGRADLARRMLDPWREVVGGTNLAVELVSHRLPGPGPGSAVHAARMAGVAHEAGVGTVLSNAVRYADRLDAPVVDVLDAARRLVPLGSVDLRASGPGQARRNAEGFLKSGKEMAEVAEEICRYAGLAGDSAGEARRLLARTRAIADRCALDPRTDLGMGEVHFPEWSFATEPSGARASDRADSPARAAGATLRARCEAAIGRRYGSAPRMRIWSRLDHELQIIDSLGYASYFLTVADVVDLVREMDIRCAARGSGAGSLVNYLLGISGVDPLRHGLLMERFLSPLRTSLPDIDIDVESARRLEVYDAVLARYGAERCACVSMMDTYRVRHAVRDVGAALGMPPTEVDAIAKAFPHIRARDARAALHELPELRPVLSSVEGTAGLAGGDLDLLFGLVEKLDGLPRHIAVHPCGILLSDATLLDRTPVETSHGGYPMSQFDKDDVEDLGLLKLDVLGIRMQSAMAHAVTELARVEDVEVDLDDEEQVRFDDADTYRMISEGRTLGVFQIESPGQRELVAKSGIESFADIITDISLFRPGPVKSDMVTPYLDAKQGWKQAVYPHPHLRPILEQTHGVVVFHEQVIELIAQFAGTSLAEADEWRRSLGDPEGMAQVRRQFHPRALSRGYPRTLVERIWAVLEGFASFGFCKAHAAAFALPTYQSAWLKAHHPAYFAAGVLTHDPGMYPKRLILEDARRFGIEVLGLDVNASRREYGVEVLPGHGGRRYGIRIALAEVKGISDAEVERLLLARPFDSLSDCWHRARVSRPVLERLVLAGGFDTVHGITGESVRRRGRVSRRDLLLQVGALDQQDRGIAGTTAASSVQLALDLDGADPSLSHGLPEMTATERVRAELEVLGLDASRHVLTGYEGFLAELGVTRSRDLLSCRSHSELLVAGVKVATQTPPVRSGRRVVFLTLDDATGPIDATFFSDVQDASAGTVFGSWLLLVRGEVRRTGHRGVSLRATGAWDLVELHRVGEQQGVEAVRELVDRPAPAPGAPLARRVLVHSSGFRTSPYADVRPAGDDPRGVPRRLWHRSPGSAG